MQQTETLKTLIDKAAAIVGSEAKLARALGVPAQHVSNWKAGSRTCMPEDRARIAGFAHEDALQELVRATLEKTEGTLRGEQLRKVLGKWLRQTGEALHSVTPGVVSLIFAVHLIDVPRCIKRQLRCSTRGLLLS